MPVRFGSFLTCVGLLTVCALFAAQTTQRPVERQEFDRLVIPAVETNLTPLACNQTLPRSQISGPAGLMSWDTLPRTTMMVAHRPLVRISELEPKNTDDLGFTSTHHSQIQLVTFTSNVSSSVGDEGSSKKPWPKPRELVKQIEALREYSEAKQWADKALELINEATQLNVDSPELDQIFSQLEVGARQIPKVANAICKSGTSTALIDSSEVSRIGYRLSRRIAVWRMARRMTTHSYSIGDDSDTNDFVAYRQISFDELDPHWVEYLHLEDLRKAFQSLSPNRAEQKKTARKVLSRIYSPVLKPGQSEFIHSILDPAIIEFLKEQACDSVEADDLLKWIERYEKTPTSFAGSYLNDLYQSLLWSDDPADQAVAAEIQTHYRNANFRLAVSERLLNRMIPSLPAEVMPVSENVQGARVSGQSHIANQIQVSLVPDPNHLTLNLETAGLVHSDTVARTKAFRILNQGEARFQVLKRLAIGRDGIDSSQRPILSSSANNYVVGVESNLDKLPVLGWVARKLAVKKLRDQAPETDRLFREKVESSAETRVQKELETQLVKLREVVQEKLFQPLMAMELEPDPLQLATTRNQVVMRYRLAGRDQMAANTARPSDNGKSLISMQLHQSTINNAIARIGLNGKQFTVEELTAHLKDVFGAKDLGAEKAAPSEHAEFGFVHHDPVCVELKDDRFYVTLNLRSLKIGKNGKTWKNLSLRVAYQITTDGMQIVLQQDDEKTKITGRRKLRLKDKAAMRTVLNVIFDPEYTVNALPDSIQNKIGGPPLEISQLVLSNGWLGVSVNETLPPITQADSKSGSRTGTIRRRMNRR